MLKSKGQVDEFKVVAGGPEIIQVLKVHKKRVAAAWGKWDTRGLTVDEQRMREILHNHPYLTKVPFLVYFFSKIALQIHTINNKHNSVQHNF